MNWGPELMSMNRGGFLIAVRDSVPFTKGGACCFSWVLHPGGLLGRVCLGNVVNVVVKYPLVMLLHYCCL